MIQREVIIDECQSLTDGRAQGRHIEERVRARTHIRSRERINRFTLKAIKWPTPITERSGEKIYNVLVHNCLFITVKLKNAIYKRITRHVTNIKKN